MIGVGRVENKVLERLLGNVADWFIDNPIPAWRKELAQANQTVYQQIYTY